MLRFSYRAKKPFRVLECSSIALRLILNDLPGGSPGVRVIETSDATLFKLLRSFIPAYPLLLTALISPSRSRSRWLFPQGPRIDFVAPMSLG